MTMTRAISALFAVIGVVLIVTQGGYYGIVTAVTFVSLLALYEYSNLTLFGPRYKWARVAFIALGLSVFGISIKWENFLLHSFVISTLFMFSFFLVMARNRQIPLEELTSKAGLSVLGIIYAGVCPVYICHLASLGNLEWFIFAFFVVFAGDTSAYFVGRKFGKSTLFSRISPKKSIEGGIGSLFGSVLTGMLIQKFLIPSADLFLMLALSILTSVVAQLGDLCESMIKRTFHAKDSGTIMPGHGGLLDRLDGILFGAPLVYIYAKYVVLG